MKAPPVIAQVEVVFKRFTADVTNSALASSIARVKMLQLYMSPGIILPRNLLPTKKTEERIVWQYLEILLFCSPNTFNSQISCF